MDLIRLSDGLHCFHAEYKQASARADVVIVGYNTHVFVLVVMTLVRSFS